MLSESDSLSESVSSECVGTKALLEPLIVEGLTLLLLVDCLERESPSSESEDLSLLFIEVLFTSDLFIILLLLEACLSPFFVESSISDLEVSDSLVLSLSELEGTLVQLRASNRELISLVLDFLVSSCLMDLSLVPLREELDFERDLFLDLDLLRAFFFSLERDLWDFFSRDLDLRLEREAVTGDLDLLLDLELLFLDLERLLLDLDRLVLALEFLFLDNDLLLVLRDKESLLRDLDLLLLDLDLLLLRDLDLLLLDLDLSPPGFATLPNLFLDLDLREADSDRLPGASTLSLDRDLGDLPRTFDLSRETDFLFLDLDTERSRDCVFSLDADFFPLRSFDFEESLSSSEELEEELEDLLLRALDIFFNFNLLEIND